MASEVGSFKTNEFLRRRKLRLQQVREQSKDIAKKIRQRAKVEKLRHVTDIDAKKEKEYTESQEKLIKRLELLYSKSLQNVGASHKDATEFSQQDIVEKDDPSKIRGREAVAELRKKKQAKLDEQKKILDRKLQAREAANELSREKSSSVAKNLIKQSSKTEDPSNKTLVNPDVVTNEDKIQNALKDNLEKAKSDMGTQWECGEFLTEWEPNIPTLSLPKEDSVKDSINEVEKSDKNKKLNLFALSDEMPSSLRGGLSNVSADPIPLKPSLTLVSEYLQNRNLKLRTNETSKKPTENLQSIKRTILHTRASRADGSVFDNVCHVLDEQIVPVPSWRAEKSECNNTLNNENSNLANKYSSIPVNRLSICSKLIQRQIQLHSFLKDPSPARKNYCHHVTKVTGKEKPPHPSETESLSLNRKKSISVYNHNTRDMVDIPYCDERFVSRDTKTDHDAYAQALKETNSINTLEKEQLNKQQDIRNKVAVTRQNVDKEYRDTLAFLNSLPKDKGTKPIRKAYMDDHQQQLLKDKQQRQLQQEFKKIEKECLKHNCKHSKRKTTVLENSRSKSQSPINNDKHVRRDFEYSWMPVPESDGSLAIHTIPSTRKTGNSVKFSETDSYHEYRSRHKHTPPTKDGIDERQSRRIETVIVQNNESNESSSVSETSSVENLNLERDTLKMDSKLKDAERIIIYKILDSRKNKKSKDHKRSKVDHPSGQYLASDINDGVGVKNYTDTKIPLSLDKASCGAHKGVSFENIPEGVYKAVTSDGDNVTSMYYSEEPTSKHTNQHSITNQSRQNFADQHCSCGKGPSKTQHDKGSEKGEVNEASSSTRPSSCKCDNIVNENVLVHPSTSTASFKTAANDKANNAIPGNGFIKLLDEGGQETGKFYIGASGFVKDDNYEVVIQLRKKDAEKGSNKEVKGMSSFEALKTTPDQKKISTEDVQEDVQENIETKLPSNVTVEREIMTEEKSKDVSQIEDQRELNNELSGSPIRSKIIMCEKAVHTSFQDTYPIPTHEPKTNPIPRQATSTYTQTSFNSSTQRPVFMHMSSSTSTAYMSPPELVLPKFLQQNHILSREEMYESENTINQLGSQYEVIDTNYCGEYEHCRCKLHSCPQKTNAAKTNLKNRNNIDTPPNTVGSHNEEQIFNEPIEIKKRKCKCHKCKSRSETKICHNSHKKRSNSTLCTKSCKDLPHIDVKSPSTQSSQHKFAKAVKDKLGNSKINPVVRKYVHKLLDLNKDGLKAIEIINQNCSIATTPGSSVINVPRNKDSKGTPLENKISLEQIKNALKQQVLQENVTQVKEVTRKANLKNNECQTNKIPVIPIRVPKKKSLHKVKSLNISRKLKRKKYDSQHATHHTKTMTSTSSSTREEIKIVTDKENNVRSKSKSYPTPKPSGNSEYKNSTSSDITEQPSTHRIKSFGKMWSVEPNGKSYIPRSNSKQTGRFFDLPGQTMTSISSDSEIPRALLKRLNTQQIPTNISTQINGIIDAEMNFMKLAEDKLQNMEKIADLTDKCTKRLSNLAKVLEEVRRNKSLVYSQISTSDATSESDNKSDKNVITETSTCDPNVLIQNNEIKQIDSSLTIPEKLDEKTLHLKESIEFTPFLKDIPKPDTLKAFSNSINPPMDDNPLQKTEVSSDHIAVKTRGRPPPALARLNLKNGQEVFVTPHELSTVIEVDSPMSLKHKNTSSRHDTKFEVQDKTHRPSDETDSHQNVAANNTNEIRGTYVNPDLLQSSVTLPRTQSKSNDSSDDSKIRMMDMKQFNDIMLKPFISLQEYAKQCNIGLDEGSNLEDVAKDEPVNDDLSSLHSDGSLPDVIAELLKRNIISEPFKFDTASNINSTTMSSESTISLIALSKTRKDKKKSALFLKNKENIAETSETVSISSNPDLENAFQKLGMGWASSTLKKTKERLALSSSSNTSSSSMTQFKIRSFSQEVPAFATDSTSSLVEISNKRDKNKSQVNDSSKNAVQQTSLTNSMTVKEFLTNVLAKKITFNNNSRTEPDGEFVSLYETNMPDEMQHTTVKNDGDQSSITSANHNRARTSTPVQIFKSTAYHSSSSSNTSNGLFSNADDLSSVKVTSTSIRNHSTSDKDELTIPNYSLKTRKGLSDRSKSD